jgi:hypothetical protein
VQALGKRSSNTHAEEVKGRFKYLKYLDENQLNKVNWLFMNKTEWENYLTRV